MNLTLLPLLQQLVLVLAAIVLFLSFVLLAQNRLISAIHAFAWQGALVAANQFRQRRRLPALKGAQQLGVCATLLMGRHSLTR